MAPFLLDVEIQGTVQSFRASDNHQMLYCLATIKAHAPEASGHLPINLSLVIDRSTSMSGRRLDEVKSAAISLIDRLSDTDVLSIITFSDRAETVLPAKTLQERNKLKSKVSRIAASGGTEIYQGLETALNEMRNVPLKAFANHLILLTDGHTYGDMTACLNLARNAAANGIDITAFGIGEDWNETFLDQLTGPSGGETAYIASSSQVAEHLQRRIKGLDSVYAQNVRLINEFPDGVLLESVFKVAPFAQPLPLKTPELRVGFIEKELPLSLLLIFKLAPQRPGRLLPIPISIMADIPGESVRDHLVRQFYDVEFVVEEPIINPPAAVIDAVRAWNLYQMNEQAWDDVEAGNLERARTRLNHLTARLREAGHTHLAERVAAETQQLAQTGVASAAGRKTLRFGTRKLVTHTATLNDRPSEISGP